MSAIDVQTRLRTPEQDVFTVAEKGRLDQERDRLLEETRRLEERNRELLEESEYLARLMEKREMLRDGKIKLKRFALKKNPLETPSGAIAKLPASFFRKSCAQSPLETTPSTVPHLSSIPTRSGHTRSTSRNPS